MAFSVAVGNYGYYNEGELRDTVIELPQPVEAIDKFLTDHGLQDAQHEEIYISDYTDGVPFNADFAETTNLYDLNILAAAMDEKGIDMNDPRISLIEYADSGNDPIDLANYIMQEDELPIYSLEGYGWNTPEANLAQEFLENSGILNEQTQNNTFSLSNYIDMDKLGSDLSYDVILGDNCYMYDTGELPDRNRYTREELETMLDLNTREQKIDEPQLDNKTQAEAQTEQPTHEAETVEQSATVDDPWKPQTPAQWEEHNQAQTAQAEPEQPAEAQPAQPEVTHDTVNPEQPQAQAQAQEQVLGTDSDPWKPVEPTEDKPKFSMKNVMNKLTEKIEAKKAENVQRDEPTQSKSMKR